MIVLQGMCACHIWDLLPTVRYGACGICHKVPTIVGQDWIPA